MQIETDNCVYSGKKDQLPVEDFMVNSKEHKLLKKFRRSLERRHNVKICMPQSTSLDSDVVFVSIQGEESSRKKVKKFLAEKMTEPKETEDKNVLLITLSDSESESDESSSISDDISFIDLCSEDTLKSENSLTAKELLNESVYIISPLPLENAHHAVAVVSQQKEKRKKRKRKIGTKVVKKAKLLDSVIEEEPVINIKPADDFIPLIDGNSYVQGVIEENSVANMIPTGDFIPLIDESTDVQANATDNDIVVIEPKTSDIPRRLRPVIIDGSNVAMEHGKSTHTFSVKGIQLAIDEFLKRGHTQVVAFVPKFRRNPNPNRNVVTTDAPLFDYLEKKQYVVFTPSRRVDGKCINSYDDRFIVDYASSSGGVIVSNDNYRDLLEESESFKETIQQRLLMFCFVGDKLMLPEDPLGRNGPRLKEYLSFPPDSTQTEENSQ